MRKTDWPGVSRDRWPSAPTLHEVVAMSRRGVSLHNLDFKLLRHTVKDCITERQVSDDIRLATRIIAKNLIGLRSSIDVPPQFLRWFRYRSGILFLTVRYNLPAGLIRFLIAQWITCPFSLWLKEHCRFRDYLKRHTPREFVQEVASPKSSIASAALAPSGEGSPEPSDSDYESEDEMAKEMREQFPELFAR